MKHEAIVRAIHGTFDEYLYLDNWWLLDVVCATILGNYVTNGLPIWLAIVGPPGSAKTVITESLRGVGGVYGIGGFTPHTFASGMRKTKSGPKKVGILEKISDRITDGIHVSDGVKFFAFNDFSTLFAMDSGVKSELLAQMRQIYDGHFEWEWGTGKKMDWRGRVGAVAASTEEWDSQMSMFRRMGERFILWREYRPSTIRPSLRALEQNDATMKTRLEGAMALLDKYEIPDDVDTKRSHNWLAELSEATVIARTIIPRDRWSKEPLDRARPESGARLAKQLNQLMKGLMLFRGEDSDHEQVRYPIMRAAIGSLPQIRLELLGELPETGATPNELAIKLHVHRNVVKRTLEDLLMLRVLAKAEDSDRIVPHPSKAIFASQVRDLWAKIQPKENDDV